MDRGVVTCKHATNNIFGVGTFVAPPVLAYYVTDECATSQE
jgi:hypothetical protein